MRNAGTPRPGDHHRPADHRIRAAAPPTSGSDESPIKSAQFEMSIVDSLRLLVDFLGLVTLTIMQRACDLIRGSTGRSTTCTISPSTTRRPSNLGQGARRASSTGRPA